MCPFKSRFSKLPKIRNRQVVVISWRCHEAWASQQPPWDLEGGRSASTEFQGHSSQPRIPYLVAEPQTKWEVRKQHFEKCPLHTFSRNDWRLCAQNKVNIAKKEGNLERWGRGTQHRGAVQGNPRIRTKESCKVTSMWFAEEKFETNTEAQKVAGKSFSRTK